MTKREQGRTNGMPGAKEDVLRARTDGRATEATEAEEAKAFEELLGGSLRGWDARIEPSVPHLLELEELVSRHREEAGRKLWRELVKLWLLGILVISGMLFLFQWNVLAFAILQSVAVAGAILFLLVSSRKNREEKRKWTG